jgi:xylulose-5-phosphate/fructose-6-phosphate phosphoketolase
MDTTQFEKYVRAANYISAAQIYLKDNFLLERPLSFDDIKPRLLGHWGTCPGINITYAHLNSFVKKYHQQMLFVLGPGHGFAALQANLFLEGTLGAYYPKAQHTADGIGYVVKNFSWPNVFPSHSNPGTPGVILEGGELGYALATAYGAALDNPQLMVACMIGDGEAETGPTATAWHLNKLINPKTNGFVLPILHINGYKISGPTIYGRMSDKELKALFTGYGYEPIFVKPPHIHEKMSEALEKARTQRAVVVEAAEKNEPLPRHPMIILQTPKGWTGIKTLHGNKIEGNALAHQVVVANANTDKGELKALEKWLRSYKFNELFTVENGFDSDIKNLMPAQDECIGNNRKCFGGKNVCVDLMLPPPQDYFLKTIERGNTVQSSMYAAGEYLRDVVRLNDVSKNFRFFSPDETYSNKLDAIFQATSRSFQLPIMEWDKDLKRDGRVIEMLSEHSLQGLMQGYVLTGRHGVFASYEAFLQIIASMTDQYIKFIRIAREIPWRGDVASLNYILTSPGWRQEHNGFSHQNPGFIDTIVQKHGCFAHVYFPPDRNSTIATLARCVASKNEVNLIVAGKSMEPQWLTAEEAERELVRGLMTWDFASDQNPDLVISSAGDYLTKEALAAISLIKSDAPEIKIRYVNILELSALGIGNESCRVPLHDFHDYFTKDKPVIFNFHGYPETLKQALFDHQDGSARFFVHGYLESGTTTTPFDMHVRNHTSRYHLVMEAYRLMAERGVLDQTKAQKLIEQYEKRLEDHHRYIAEYGTDPKEIEDWQWHLPTSS